MFKVVIYSHDTFGVGHLSRAIKLSQAIMQKKKDAAIIIVTGTAVPNLIDLPAGVELIKLPSLKSIRGETITYESFNTKINPEEILKMRESILLDIIKNFKPDLLLVDFSPKGVKNELVKSLEYIGKKLKTKKYITFRDIIDDPNEVIAKWERRNYESIFERYYDKILIFGDKNINDFTKEYKLSDKISKKLHYLGYLVTETKPKVADKSDKILVTVGGGRDGCEIINKFLENFVKLGEFSRFTVEVICGPLSEKKFYENLITKYSKFPKIKIIWNVKNLSERMPNYDLIVSMGGYNSFCEILSAKVPALIIPRETFEKEQLIRAKIFQKLGIINYISLSEITPEALEKKLNETLALSRTIEQNISKLNIQGLENFKNVL